MIIDVLYPFLLADATGGCNCLEIKGGICYAPRVWNYLSLGIKSLCISCSKH